MKKLLLLFAFIYSINILNAQTTFRVSYDIAAFDLSGGMVQTPAGDFVMAGTNATFLPLYGNAMKLNASGNVVWAKSFTGGIATDIWDIKNVSTGGFIMCGSSSGSGAILIRIDDNGNLLWANRYSLPNRPGDDPSNEYANAVIETSDGGFLVGGGVDFFWDGVSANTVDTTSAFGFKVNSTGVLQWSRVWTIATTNPDEHFINDVGESADGYFFVGESSEGAGTPNSDGDYPRNALLIKTNTSGTLTYARRWGNGNTNSEGINSIIRLASGDMLLGGYDNVDAFLFRLNGTGASPTTGTFKRRIRGTTLPPSTYIIQDIMENADGNYSTIGWNISLLTFNSTIFKFNSVTGAQMLGVGYSPIGLSSILPEGGLAADQGYFMTMTDQQAGGFNYNIIKTDAAGSLVDLDPGCPSNPMTPTLSSYDPVYTVLTPGVFTLGTANSFTPIVSNLTPTKTGHCLNVVCTPPAAPTASASPTTICNGQSSTITSTAPAGVTFYYYTTSTGGTAFASGNSTVVSPTTTTTYYVESDDNANPGCVSTRTAVTITVVQPPNAGTSTSTSVCSNGSPVNLYTLLGGSPNTGGSWSGPSALTGGFNGTFTPGTNTAGVYTYTVAATAPCSGPATATVTVTVNTAPNAGTSATTTVCSNGSAVNLFSLLTGSPQTGGSWSGPSVLTGGSNGTFTPGTNTAGIYTYTVNGTAPCSPTSTATVTVNVTSAPNAGTSASTSVCSNGSPVNLFSLLTGSPQTGGTWSGPSALTGGSNGTFTPGTNTGGIYTYTVAPTSPCTGSSTATITVTVNTAPNAGTSATTTVCSNGSAVNLFSLLTGSPQTGGSWSGPSVLTGGSNGTFTPGTNTAGTYTYTVSGTAPCSPTSTATVTVSITNAPNAGTTTSANFCSNGSPVNLFSLLGGSAQTGGSWSGPSALTGGSNGTFTPGTNTAGAYVYTVTGVSPCSGTSTATVTVTITGAPNSGTSATTTVCSNGTPINLLSILTGAPQGGGTWTGPSTLTGGSAGTYTPGTNVGGVYTYTVTGVSPCSGTVSSTVTVNQVAFPNPGTSNTITLCSDGSPVNLLSQLGGSPQTGGTWTGPSTLTGGSNGTFNPATNVAGVYTYTINATSPCTGSQAATVTVIVSTAPNSGTSASTSICSNGSSVNLFSSLGGSPSTNGTWSGPSTLTGGSLGTFTPGTNTAGTYTYTVNGTAPCAASSVSTVTVSITTAPNAGTSTTLNICANDPAVNLLSLLGGSASVSGSWSGPSVLTGGSNGTFTPGTNTAGTYTYTVAGTSPCLDAQTTVVVTVNSLPTAPTANASSTTICDGQSTTITASGIGASTFNIYDAASGGNFLGAAPLSVSPSTTTTYYVEAVNSNGCSHNGALVPITITVLPIDDPSWTTPGATCEQAGSINLDALITGTTGGTWSGTGVTGSSFDPTGLAGQTISITYTVGSAPCQQTSTQTISVQALITGTWTNPGAMCESDGILNLNSLITGTAGGTWSGTGVTGNTFDPTGLSGSVSITYTVGVNPCIDIVTQSITINSSPLDPTVNVTTDTVCLGDAITITASGSGAGVTYNVYDAATGGTLIGTTPLTFTPTTSGSYYVEATNANGCVNLGGRDEVAYVVNANPVAEAGANTTVCPGDNATLVATGGGTYLWSTTETTASILVSPSTITTYYVTVTNAAGCTDTDSVIVDIYSGAGSLDAIDDSTTTESGILVITDVAVNDAGNISSISIISGPDNGSATVNGTEITYTSNSDYIGNDTIVYVTCDAFCSSYCDTAVLVIRVTEEIVIEVPSGFSPNGDGLNDIWEIVGLYKYPENELWIYNRWGELVFHAKPYENDWHGQSNNDKLKLTGEEVTDGTYFYVLKLTPDDEGMNGYIELRRR